MSFDYGPLAKLAQAQIKDKGRSVTLRLVVSSFVAASGVTTTTTSDITVFAVFADVDAGQIDGSMIRRGDKQVLIAALDATPSLDHTIIDGGRSWNIVAVKTVAPGPMAIFYECQARDA